MTPQRWIGSGAVLGIALLAAPSRAAAQARSSSQATPPASPEEVVARALGASPITAPYRFRVTRQNGRLLIAGRAGTKQVHDVAVRIAMAVSPSIDDRIVIDTAAAHEAVGVPAANSAAPFAPWLYGSGGSPTTYLPGPAGAPYVYPEPLFGRYDDPFYGFEPPLVSYPPWWGLVNGRVGDPYAAPVLDPTSPIGPDPGPGPVGTGTATDPRPSSAIPEGSVEMTIDPRGVAVLRGTVPAMKDRVAIGQKVERMEGVTEVINQLETRDDAAPTFDPKSDVPPPPPEPDPDVNRPSTPPSMPRLAPAPPASIPPPASSRPPARPGEDPTLGRRVEDALARRPALAGSRVDVSVRDGIASLSGTVPSALEAMAAFRAAQQTVGISAVEDRLQFTVPDGRKPNPLVSQGRPEDVEPYLLAQVRRQIGGQAHVDRVRVTGDSLELIGTLARPEDRPRVDAILRSMPLLRGFRVEARFIAD